MDYTEARELKGKVYRIKDPGMLALDDNFQDSIVELTEPYGDPVRTGMFTHYARIYGHDRLNIILVNPRWLEELSEYEVAVWKLER